MPAKPLTTEEMREARVSFGHCMFETFENMLPEETAKVQAWTLAKVVPIIPCFCLRVDSVQQLTDSIFSDADIRDFCLNLSFRFFTLNGSAQGFAESLALSLKEGLAIDGPQAQLSVIPSAIRPSLPQSVFDEFAQRLWGWVPFTKRSIRIEQFLASNKHLMVVLMLHLNTQLRAAD